jgi:hypothetical protein
MLGRLLQENKRVRQNARAELTLQTKRLWDTRNTSGLHQGWEDCFNDVCLFCGKPVIGFREMAGHLKACKRRITPMSNMDVVNINEDFDHDNFDQDAPEYHLDDNSQDIPLIVMALNKYYKMQQIAIDFSDTPNIGAVRLSDGSFKTPNWLHYLEISKFGNHRIIN